MISSIFKWYKRVFGGTKGVLNFIKKYAVDDDKRVFLTVPPGYASDREVLLREDFNNLKNWKPLHFQKINEHTESIITNSYAKEAKMIILHKEEKT